jgi:hypothetical protein
MQCTSKFKKDTFLLHTRHASAFVYLDDEQKARLLEAIFQYNIDGEIGNIKLNTTGKIVFNYIKDDIDSNNKVWNEKVLKCIEAGKKGGRPKNK